MLDPVPTTLLKMYLEDLMPLICRIANDSLLSGSLPEQFKETVVTPLPPITKQTTEKKGGGGREKKKKKPGLGENS